MMTITMLLFASVQLGNGLTDCDVNSLSFSPQGIVTQVRDNARVPFFADHGVPDSFYNEFTIGRGTGIASGIGLQFHPDIAFDGTNYLAIWVDERETWTRPMMQKRYVTSVIGARINQNGVMIDTVGIQIHRDIINGPDNVALDYGAGVYLVAWSEYGPGPSYDVWAARVTTQGVVLDPDGILLCNADGFQDKPNVAYGDSMFLVTWSDSRNSTAHIRAARVTPQGTVLDPDGLEFSDQYSETPIGFDGTNWLVVWEDGRNGGKSIFGARISRDGVVLDPSGINISNNNATCRYPAVSFNGTNYLVVWQDQRTGQYDIWGTRVDDQGVVLDPAGIHVTDAAGEQWRPNLAFDGVNWYVAWQDQRSGDANVYGGRINASGTVLDPSGTAISVNANYQGCPAVCFGASGYIVTWHDNRSGVYEEFEIYGSRIQTSGTVLDPQGLLLSLSADHQISPRIAYDGTNYLVVWEEYRGQPLGYDICGARVAQDGTILDPLGLMIAASSDGEYSPSVAFNGTNYLVVYERLITSSNYRDIYSTRVTPAGVVLNPAGVRVSRQGMDELDPAVASDGNNWFVIWEFDNGSDPSLYAARVSSSGTVLDDPNITVCNADGWQWVPAVVYNGTNYLAVWSDNRDFTADIYGARITTSGTVLDPNGFYIAGGGNYERYPAVAFNGTCHLVTWESQPIGGESNVFASRIDLAGNVLDLIQLTSDPYDQYSPAVCCEGQNFMVTWHREYNYPYMVPSLVQGARVKPDGTILDTFVVSNIPGRSQLWTALCRGPADQILVAYTGYLRNPYMAMRIVGRFWTPPISVAENAKGKTCARNLVATPNPFIGYTRIINPFSEFVDIYDIQGRHVGTDRNDRVGAGLLPGVYFLRPEKNDGRVLKVLKIN